MSPASRPRPGVGSAAAAAAPDFAAGADVLRSIERMEQALQADPTDGSVLIFLAHNMVELHQMAEGIGLGVWSAIAAFHETATS